MARRIICNAEQVGKLIENGHDQSLASSAFVWSQTTQKHGWWLAAFAKAEEADGVYDEETLSALMELRDAQLELDNPPAVDTTLTDPILEASSTEVGSEAAAVDAVVDPALDETVTAPSSSSKEDFKNKRR